MIGLHICSISDDIVSTLSLIIQLNFSSDCKDGIMI